MIFSDRELAARLERTEAKANADFVETRSQLEPDSAAEWIEEGGAYAMFDGVESPLTQTFGLGVFQDATSQQLERLEEFFTERGANIYHEVSPMADLSLLSLLGERGYQPIELTSVLCKELTMEDRFDQPRNSAIGVRPITESEADLWAEVASEGWSTEHESLAEFMLAFGKIAARTSGSIPFIAEIEGRPVGAASFAIYDDVCLLSGASTIVDARRQGVQSALLAGRLRYGAEHGCGIAMMCALPGSQSQKNAQRNGFEIAYTRIKWQLKNLTSLPHQ